MAISAEQQKVIDWIDQEKKHGEDEFLASLEETGAICTLEEWAERDKRIAQTEMLSTKIADRMTELGIEGGGYHDGEPIQIVTAHSQQIKKLPPWRRCNSIPARAQEKRNGLLNALIYFVEYMTRRNSGVRFRHICIHDGPRCYASELLGRWRVQGKRINRWNKSEWAKRLGCMFVFRSHEAGSPVKKQHSYAKDKRSGKRYRPYIFDANGDRIRCLDENGRQTWHPHTHAILMMQRKLTDEEWAELIRRIKAHFDVIKPDHGILKEPREACKYLVKCDELMNCDDEGFKEFILETKGARLVSVLGPFSNFRKALDKTGRKVICQKNPDTAKAEYRIIKNWNSNAASRVANKTEGEEVVEAIRRDLMKKHGPLMRPALIARMAPQQTLTPIAEPVFMVRGHHIDLDEFYARPQVASVRAITRDDYEAGAALFEIEFGLSVESWLSQGLAAAQAASVGVDLSTHQTALWGSAHNTPVNGRNPLPASQSAKPDRGKNERSEVPIGGPEALFSNQPTLKAGVEPPGAVNRNQNTRLDGSPCLLGATSPETFSAAEYFGA